jgi:large subunit ribosomal protein L24
MAKIKRNDEVIIIAGRDKGKYARVVRVITAKNRVMLEDSPKDPQGRILRKIKKHVKPNPQTGAQGGIQELAPTVHISNVALLDADGKATRVGYQGEGKEKARIARSTGATFADQKAK